MVSDKQACDDALKRFTEAMEMKLTKTRMAGRYGGFDKRGCTAQELSRLLREHIEKGDPIDVANYCLMLFARNEEITPVGEPEYEGKELKDYRIGGQCNCGACLRIRHKADIEEYRRLKAEGVTPCG